MNKGGIGEAVFVGFGFDQKEDFFVIFMKNIVVDIGLVKVLRLDNLADVAGSEYF